MLTELIIIAVLVIVIIYLLKTRNDHFLFTRPYVGMGMNDYNSEPTLPYNNPISPEEQNFLQAQGERVVQ